VQPYVRVGPAAKLDLLRRKVAPKEDQMKRKLPLIAAGVAGFALLVGSNGIASAAEDDTFSPLDRDPTSSRTMTPLSPDESIVPMHMSDSFTDTTVTQVEASVVMNDTMGETYTESWSSGGPAATSQVIMADDDAPGDPRPWGFN